MKLIDRFLLRQVLVPLVYCLLTFVLIWVVYDLFNNLSEFVKADTPLLQVVQFYINLIPSVLIIIVPISILLAVLYSLSQLTKNNELTAMRASGLSLYRLLVPVLVLGFLLSTCVAVINETLGPWSAYWCDQFVRSQKYAKEGDTFRAHVQQDHPFRNVVAHRNWFIDEFDTVSYSMLNVEVMQERANGSNDIRYRADTATWLDGRWWFHDVEVQRFDTYSYPMGPPTQVAIREMTEFTERPKDFLNEIRYSPDFLSCRELAYYVKTRPNLSDKVRARYLVDYHYRLAMPWTGIVTALLGIPFGAQTGRKGAFLGVLLTIGMFFGFWVLITFCLALGKQQHISPFLAGWTPNIIFGTLGLVLLYRMR